ncbi:MAG TPA: hypothetical protein VLD36_11025 [Burkholderiales bacterium]|nr:hypothetical protein [Burkholderiales bacterium]
MRPGRLAPCLVAAALAGCAYGYTATERGTVRHRASPFMLWEDAWRPAPKMAAGRAINEQDCSQPIAAPGANLKCR